MASPIYTKVACEPEHRASTKDFLQIVTDIGRSEGWRESDTFSRWLSMATAAQMNPVLNLRGRWDEWDANEALYMDEVKRMRSPETTEAAMGKLLGVVVEAMEASPKDFLGPIFMELSANAGQGQFFTPWALCEAMARMTLKDAPMILETVRREGRSYITAHEPACGAGGTILAANLYLKEQGFDPARNIHWQCTDIDWRCVCATYIQLNLSGASALVTHGDTLRAECHRILPTIAATLHPKTFTARASVRERVPAAVREAEPMAAADVHFYPTRQTSLFGDTA